MNLQCVLKDFTNLWRYFWKFSKDPTEKLYCLTVEKYSLFSIQNINDLGKSSFSQSTKIVVQVPKTKMFDLIVYGTLYSLCNFFTKDTPWCIIKMFWFLLFLPINIWPHAYCMWMYYVYIISIWSRFIVCTTLVHTGLVYKEAMCSAYASVERIICFSVYVL